MELNDLNWSKEGQGLKVEQVKFTILKVVVGWRTLGVFKTSYFPKLNLVYGR